MPPTKRWAPTEPQREICGTTDKTVKRAVERPERPRRPSRTRRRRRTTTTRSPTSSPSGWRRPRAGSRPSASCPWSGPPATRARPATSAGPWPRPRPTWRRDHHRGRRPGVWAPGDMLVFDWGEIGPLFVFCAVLAWSRFRFVLLRRQPGGRDDHGRAGRVHGDHRRGAQDPAHRPHGVPEGRNGGRARDPDAGLRALRHPLRHPAGLLRGGGPGVQGHRREPGRLREVRPHDPRGAERHRPRRGQRQGRGVVRRGQRPGALGDLRRPRRAPRDRAPAARRLPSLRARIGKVVPAQGRPAELCAVRLGPLLGAHRPHRAHRSSSRWPTARSLDRLPGRDHRRPRPRRPW